MLFLNGRDLELAITPDELIRAVEAAFELYEGDDFSMPPRMHAEYEGNVLLLMPSFTNTEFGTKLLTVFPDNQGRGTAVIQGVMVLNDAETGTPLALMDAAVLTGMRTAAVGAAGIKHLSHAGAGTLGIVGAGVQAWYLARISHRVRDFGELFITDINREKSEDLAAKLRESTGLNVSVLDPGREILEASDVVVTATTSLSPVIPGERELLEGKTFVGIGSFKPQMREYPAELYSLLDRIYIDSRQAVEESGDLVAALESGFLQRERIKTLGSFIMDPDPIPEGSTQFFKSVGMALFDLVVARKIFESAKEMQLGTNIDFP